MGIAVSGPRPFAAGERALLVDAKARRYLITLAEGGEFHTHAGITSHDAILGQQEGITQREAGQADRPQPHPLRARGNG